LKEGFGLDDRLVIFQAATFETPPVDEFRQIFVASLNLPIGSEMKSLEMRKHFTT
jgi:hypothetical protein